MLDLPVVIFCGGKGTRIRPVFPDIPKSLIPVGDKRLLDILIEQVRKITDGPITLATGFLASQIEEFALEYKNKNIVTVRDEDDCGTAGALKRIVVHREYSQRPLMVLNGDTLFEPLLVERLRVALSYEEFRDCLVVRALANSETLGSKFDFTDAGVVTSIWRSKILRSEYAHTGIWILDPTRIYWDFDMPCDLEFMISDQLARGLKLKLLDLDMFGFADLGTPASYRDYLS